MGEWKNQLYFGDNLQVLREYIPVESVDLIYLDPPFNSNATYNVLFTEQGGEKSTAQIKAFEDTWHWSEESEAAYHELVIGNARKLADLMQALRAFLGTNDMMAYLVMMAIRLVELHRVLKPTGSLYLHCDPTASHYLKLVLDAIFGTPNYRNEIIWQRTRVAKQQSGFFGKVHDVILFYTKNPGAYFKEQYTSYPESYQRSHYNQVESDTGRRFGLWDLTQAGPGPARNFGSLLLEPPPGKHWIWSQDHIDAAMADRRIAFTRNGTPRLKRYLDEAKGEYVRDIWTDIFSINAVARERLGYPTQKPEALLERILRASSNEGDVVLDPFCGCGTAIAAAEGLKRHWIGIDITHLAIMVMRHRLHRSYGMALLPYEVIGVPTDLAGAEALAQEDRHQFEWWALGLVHARPAHGKRKGPDGGVDGVLPFFEDDSGQAKNVIVSVKSGKVDAPQVRDLKGVLERDKAPIGAFVTLREPTRNMREEALSAGYYVPQGMPEQRYPRLQILTIADLLAGKQLQCPQHNPPALHLYVPPKAPPTQPSLFTGF